MTVQNHWTNTYLNHYLVPQSRQLPIHQHHDTMLQQVNTIPPLGTNMPNHPTTHQGVHQLTTKPTIDPPSPTHLGTTPTKPPHQAGLTVEHQCSHLRHPIILNTTCSRTSKEVLINGLTKCGVRCAHSCKSFARI